MSINTINYEQRQSISLSRYAESVLQSDIWTFPGMNYSALVNRIIENSSGNSDADISRAVENERRRLVRLLTAGRKACMDPAGAENTSGLSAVESGVLDMLAAGYGAELSARVCSYAKDVTKKIRLHNEAVRCVRDWEQSNHGGRTVYRTRADYIKAVIEEYALKPLNERERIICRQVTEPLVSAINGKNAVRIEYENTHGETVSWFVRPYRVMLSQESLYNYLVGFSSKPGGGDERLASFRLSRIKDVRIYYGSSHGSGVISRAEASFIEKKLEIEGPQFLVGDSDRITVRLTKEGMNMYRTQLYLRPAADRESIVPDGYGNTEMQFDCTQRQIEYYFFKFGREAAVVSPEKLRQNMKKRYLEACKAYDEA